MYHQFSHEYELALGYHKKACELGSGIACANISSIYWNGYGEQQFLDKLLTLLKEKMRG